MKRIVTIIAVLTLSFGLGGAVFQIFLPRTFLAWTGRPGDPEQIDSAVAKDKSLPSEKKGETTNSDGTIDMQPESIEAQAIKIAPAANGIFVQVLSVPGTITLDPSRVARVPGRVVGTVTRMTKRLGDSVTEGEVVAALDSREVADAKTEYLTAAVAHDLQTTLFERAQTLWAKRVSAEQQYLQARTSFLEKKLRLDLAKQKLTALNLNPVAVENASKRESAAISGTSSLREYEIRSMIGGRVIERKVYVGSLVSSQGDPSDLYTIADLSEVWVELAVPIADLDMIEVGQRVTIASQRESSKRGEGPIIFISPLVDPETRSARVTAQIDNELLIWRPGAVVTGDIAIKEVPVKVCVPRAAIQNIGGESVVFARTPSGFQRRAVTSARSNEDSVEITSGLAAGEEIAVKNTFLLKAELGKREAGAGDQNRNPVP